MKYLNKLFAWMGSDGMMSAIICAFLNLLLPWWVAGVITLAIGVGKEIYDRISGKGCSEIKDVVCDVIGIIIGIV